MTTNISKIIKLDSTRTGILLICIVSLIWAAMEIVIQHIPGGYSLYQVVWVRYTAHLLFMLLVFAPRHGIKELVSTQRLRLQFLRAVMMLIMPVSFIIAVEYMSAGNILTIFWLSPLMIMALSMILLKEKAGWQYWAIAFVGLTCSVLLLNPNRSVTVTGITLSLAMGLSFSLYLVMTRMLREESTLTNLFYTAVGVLIPLSLRLPNFWKPLSLQSGLMMALVGLLGFALLWVLDKALERTSTSVTAPFLYSQIFWMIAIRLIIRIF